MKNCILLTLLISFLAGNVLGDTHFHDGGYYLIDYTINDNVWIDWASNPIPGTQMEIVTGGIINGWFNVYGYGDVTIDGGTLINYLSTHSNSNVTILNGTVGYFLGAKGNSNVTILDGVIHDELTASQTSNVTVYDGSIGAWVDTYHNSHVSIYGSIIIKHIYAEENSEIVIYGSFGSYGDLPVGSPVFIWPGHPDNVPSGHITGTLANGDPIDNDYYIFDNASITLVNYNAVRIVELGDLIVDEGALGNIDDEMEVSLLAKADAAFAALDKGNPNAAKVAMNDLKALINQVEAQTGKKITAKAAAEIIECINAIIEDLDG